MKQTIFKDGDEELVLRSKGQPLSLEESIHYLRTLATQLEQHTVYY